MADRNNFGVTCKLHKSFFDNVFEKERKRLETKMGVKLSQNKFTHYLAQAGASFKIPKQRTNCMPKVNRRRRFGGFSLI